MSVQMAYLGIIAMWSTTPLAIKWSGEEVGFLFGISARMLIAALVCVAVFILLRWPLPTDKRALHVYIAIGLPLYGAFLSVYWGAQYIPSGMISIIFGLTPIFTGLFAAFWLKENAFSISRILGMLLGILGLGIIFQNSLSSGVGASFGVSMVVLAAIIHSFGTVWAKYVVSHLRPFTANTGGVCVAASLCVLTMLVSGEPIPDEIPVQAKYSILYLAIFGSILGAVMFFYALRHVEATTMGMLTLITPVIAIFIGYWFNNEVIDVFTILGTISIMIGLLSYQWTGMRKRYIRARVNS